MKLITFNLRIDLESDGANRWANRLPTIAALLGGAGYPLVCTQEADAKMLAELLAAVPQYHAVGEPREDGRGEGAPILYDPKVLHCEETKTLWLSDTPRKPSKFAQSNFNRIAVYAIFRTTEGIRFRIVNTHLDYADPAVREQQAGVLLQRLSVEHATDPIPLLVTGDFNAGPKEPVHHLFQNGAGVRLSSVYGNVPPAATYRAFGEIAGSTIDYVYTWGVKVSAWRLVPSPEALRMSDHEPVEVTFALPK